MFRKKEVPQPVARLVATLQVTANIKKRLALTKRGWLNKIGLYVQLREAGGAGRLEAGDHWRKSQVDVWFDNEKKTWGDQYG